MTEIKQELKPNISNEKNGQGKSWKRFLPKSIPSSFSIIVLLILFFIMLSWILKAAGTTFGTTNEKVVGLGFLDVFTSIWYGFKEKADVILFILCVGGLLNIMTRTKAIDAAIQRVVEKLNGKEIFMVPALMLIFGLGGTTYGMWEETIAFFPILIPVFVKAGFGSFTAVLTILVGAGVGTLASTVNPFAVGAVPNYEQGTLMGTRWLSWIIFMAIAISFVTWIAHRTKTKNYSLDGLDSKAIEKKFAKSEKVEFTYKRIATIVVFILGFVLMIAAYLPWVDWVDEGKNYALDSNDSWDKYMFWVASTGMWEGGWGGWYFIAVSGVFLLVSVIVFIINRNDFVEKDKTKDAVFINTFVDGSKDVLSVCMLIATAGGLAKILTTSKIGDLIANQASSLDSLGVIGFVVVIFLMSMMLSFLVPSTSGFAGAFMPIFFGITLTAFGGVDVDGNEVLTDKAKNIQGVVVLAFIFSSGIINLISPTSAALMAYTKYAGVNYPFWIKKIAPLIGVLFIVALLLIIIFGAMVDSGTAF